MGNLPNSRTATLASGDPIPEGLLEEIQDCIINTSRQGFQRTTWAQIISGAALFTEAANPVGAGSGCPVRKFIAAGTIMFAPNYDAGDIIYGFQMQLYGDGAVDASITPLFYAGMNTAPGASLATPLSITNVPAAWTTYTVAGFSPTTLTAGGILVVQVNANAANLYMGPLLPLIRR